MAALEGYDGLTTLPPSHQAIPLLRVQSYAELPWSKTIGFNELQLLTILHC